MQQIKNFLKESLNESKTQDCIKALENGQIITGGGYAYMKDPYKGYIEMTWNPIKDRFEPSVSKKRIKNDRELLLALDDFDDVTIKNGDGSAVD